MSRNFMELLQAMWDDGKFVCVGLDSDEKKLPKGFDIESYETRQSAFNRHIVNSTAAFACAYKPNLAFYRGSAGKENLRQTIDHIHALASEIPVILDAKVADIGNTNDAYAEEYFDWYGADAVTVHPYLGMEAMKPFLDRADKGVIVLCRTSNSGAGEFQDIEDQIGWPLYQTVAQHVAEKWGYNSNCAVVVGATYPEELAKVREIVGDMPILIPGIGAQGGEVEATVKAGANPRGQGMIINSSRGIIFASSGPDFAEAARHETQKLHDQITAALEGVRT